MGNLVVERQKKREARDWPELDALVLPLARALPSRLADKLPGKVQIGKRHRELLRAVPDVDLARAILTEVIAGTWVANLKKRRQGLVLQETARRVGMQAFRVALRQRHPDIGPLVDAAFDLVDPPLTLACITAAGLYLLHTLHISVPNLLGLYEQYGRRKVKNKKTGKVITPRAFSYYVRLKPETMAQYGGATFVRALAYRPMLEPPKRWSPGSRGGYQYALRGTLPLIRNVPATAADPNDCPTQVCDVLNRLQETAWQINHDVLDVAWKLQDRLLGHQPRGNREHVTAWALRRALAEAEEDRNEPEFYFVHCLDYRGRVYPVGSHLSPHGPDLVRALLRFRDGADVTREDKEDVATALDRYGAGCLRPGRKLSLEQIERIVQDPVKNRADWWDAAKDKKRWLYLAYCFERMAFERALKDGASFRTTLPIWQDAHANGFQHYALLLGDESLAKEVRLTPPQEGEEPADIYKVIARRMTKRLASAAARDPIAARLLERCGSEIARAEAKHPATVFIYGGQDGGYEKFLKQLRKEDREAGWKDETVWRQEDAERQRLAECFANVAVTVLQEVAPRASELQRWLYDAGLAIALRGARPHWVVPVTGFRVIQPLTEKNSRAKHKLSIVWDGKERRLRVPQERIKRLDKRAQARGLAPNLIHSLDAAHLAWTVRLFEGDPSPPIATVHDNFATLATHAGVLATSFAETLHEMYDRRPTPYADLVAQLQQQGPGIRTPPEQGPWCLTGTLDFETQDDSTVTAHRLLYPLD